MWYDKSRKMFYVGMHSGDTLDTYVSSSHWLNAEVKYRPSDFVRRIIKLHKTRTEAKRHEGKLLAMISDSEFGVKYYNYKHGAPKGTTPWNKNKPMTDTHKKNLSISNSGREAWNKGMPNPTAAENGKKSAKKLSQTVTGRKRKYNADGSWTWTYPNKISD